MQNALNAVSLIRAPPLVSAGRQTSVLCASEELFFSNVEDLSSKVSIAQIGMALAGDVWLNKCGLSVA